MIMTLLSLFSRQKQVKDKKRGLGKRRGANTKKRGNHETVFLFSNLESFLSLCDHLSHLEKRQTKKKEGSPHDYSLTSSFDSCSLLEIFKQPLHPLPRWQQEQRQPR